MIFALIMISQKAKAKSKVKKPAEDKGKSPAKTSRNMVCT
jgi:hypothetical protein